MNVYMPHVTGGAEVKAQTEAEAVAEKAPTAGYLSGALKTEAGEVFVSQQLLDRAGPNFSFDRLIFDQLNRNYNLRVDTYALEEALHEPTEQSWSGSSGSFILLEKEKAGGYYGQVAKAMGKIRTEAGTVLNPSHVFLRPEFLSFISSWADTYGRPVLVPNYAGPSNAGAAGGSGDFGIEGDSGYKIHGLPLFTDQNIPNQGTTSQQQTVVGDLGEVWIFEGAKVPRVIPQTKANELLVLLQIYAYITCIVRYPKGIVVINGTGAKISYTN